MITLLLWSLVGCYCLYAMTRPLPEAGWEKVELPEWVRLGLLWLGVGLLVWGMRNRIGTLPRETSGRYGM